MSDTELLFSGLPFFFQLFQERGFAPLDELPAPHGINERVFFCSGLHSRKLAGLSISYCL